MSGRSSTASERDRSAALTPSKAAYRLTNLLNAISQAHGTPRFPIDVQSLALEAANIFKWDDPITEVRGEAINNFDGALFPDDGRKRWLLLYNNALKSLGRIKFTQAHELGHYLLHRHERECFQCTDEDMVDFDLDERDIEAEADYFASTLLMPLDDFRAQMGTESNLDAISGCADRYGVSLTAALLRWLGYTDHNAVMVIHRDGYVLKSKASQSAFRCGAFFPSRRKTIAVPGAALASSDVSKNTIGVETDAKLWFSHVASGTTLREMKVTADHYDFAISLLVLPRGTSAWKPRYPNGT